MTIDIMKKDIMNMTPNECAIMIVKKEEEIQKLKRTVERLRKKCKRYEKKLSDIYLNGEFN